MKYSSLAALVILSGGSLALAAQPLLPVDQIPVPPARTAAVATAVAPPATQPAEVTGRVVILPFVPLGEVNRREWVAPAVQQTLATEIARLGGLSPVLSHSAQAAPDTVAAQEAARTVGGDVVILGAFQFTGSEVRFTGQIVHVSDGTTIGALKASGDFRDLFELEDELAAQLHRALRPAPQSGTAVAKTDNSAIFAGSSPVATVNPSDFFAPPSDASRFADPYQRYYYAQPSPPPYFLGGSGGYGGYGVSYSGWYPSFGFGFGYGGGRTTLIIPGPGQPGHGGHGH